MPQEKMCDGHEMKKIWYWEDNDRQRGCWSLTKRQGWGKYICHREDKDIRNLKGTLGEDEQICHEVKKISKKEDNNWQAGCWSVTKRQGWEDKEIRNLKRDGPLEKLRAIQKIKTGPRKIYAIR